MDGNFETPSHNTNIAKNINRGKRLIIKTAFHENLLFICLQILKLKLQHNIQIVEIILLF